MATYFLSDPHGAYELFLSLLAEIGFSEEDTMYVLGDFLDKGCSPVSLASFIAERKNIRAIRGNHEHDFLSYYHALMRELGDESARGVLNALRERFPTDGYLLSWEIVDHIESLPYYIEEKDFLCVHAGLTLSPSGEILPLATQKENVLVFDRRFKEPSVLPVSEKTVLFGHTPCSYDGSETFIKTPKIGKSPTSTRFSDYSKIRLDTGVALTGRLGCLRKEDMKEFYVTK